MKLINPDKIILSQSAIYYQIEDTVYGVRMNKNEKYSKRSRKNIKESFEYQGYKYIDLDASYKNGINYGYIFEDNNTNDRFCIIENQELFYKNN
jgi:hypothetical protein